MTTTALMLPADAGKPREDPWKPPHPGLHESAWCRFAGIQPGPVDHDLPGTWPNSEEWNEATRRILAIRYVR